MYIQDKLIEFNKSLLDDETICDMVSYMKKFNNIYGELINITLMNELSKYNNEYTCCIPHEMLVKYNILSDDNKLADNVKTLIDQSDFIENKDYLIVDDQDKVLPGAKHKITYMFHPTAFKLCLMTAENNKIYIDYMLLDTIYKYYNDYQIQYNDNQINELNKKLIEKTKIMNEKRKELDEQNKIMNEKRKIMNEKCKKINETVNTLMNENNFSETEFIQLIEDILNKRMEYKN
jgi:hypothetical protein